METFEIKRYAEIAVKSKISKVYHKKPVENLPVFCILKMQREDLPDAEKI